MLRFREINHYLGEYAELEKAAGARKKTEEKYFAPILERYSVTEKTNFKN